MLSIFLALLFGVGFIIYATASWKLHPFFALLIAAYIVGISAGLPLADLGGLMAKGFGNTLGSIGIIIAAGSTIGVVLERSGATIRIADSLLGFFGQKRSTLGMTVIGYLISIPVFCDSAYIILSSTAQSLSQRSKQSIIGLSVALATGLYAAHTLIPPTPGPVAAAATLEIQQLGMVILFGALFAVPAAMAGYFYSLYLAKRYPSSYCPDFEPKQGIAQQVDHNTLPSLAKSLLPVLLPVLLIAFGTMSNLLLEATPEWIRFVGNPVNALLSGVLASLPLLPKWNEETLSGWFGSGLKDAALILLITGAGGTFGFIIRELNPGQFLENGLAGLQIGLFLPFLMAALLKTAQGSSTVAIITTAAIMLPLLSNLGLDSEIAKTMVVMSIGAGAMTVSHANDSYFWVVSQFTGMDTTTAYRSITVSSLLQGVSTLIFVLVVGAFLGFG